MQAPQGAIKDRLLDRLYQIIAENPTGIKEYELYQQLKKAKIQPFTAGNLADELVLYRTHFLLFHLLYSLQDRLRKAAGEDLEIHCLRICLKPWHPTPESIPAKVDPLRSYYMEVERLETVHRSEVQGMLADFWRQFKAEDGRSDALLELGLQDPVAEQEIKRQFRKLAKQHHPDRGGDPAQFRRITAAVETLLGCQ